MSVLLSLVLSRARRPRPDPTRPPVHFQQRSFRIMQRKTAVAAVAASALAAPAAAEAHVTLQPSTAVAGASTVENVRVPNERDNASTVKVDLQLPHGFVAASYQPRPGWSVNVTTAKLAKPIQTDDGPIDTEVRRITFTGHGPDGKIAPGQFMDFPLSVQIPGKAGDKLTFKALQTYSNGEVVRWIGAPDSDTPAPIVTVTGADAAKPVAPTSAPTTPPKADNGGGGASKGLAWTALIVGALGLVAGLAAVATRRSGVKAG
jgi:periplasmic copper chaperone A